VSRPGSIGLFFTSPILPAHSSCASCRARRPTISPPATPTPAASLREITLAHAIRLMEEAGALDDASEMAQALARQSSEQGRILQRARLLARRLGLLNEWDRLQTGLWIAAGLLLVLAYLLAGGLLTRVLGSGQTVNAAFAFVAMLGVPGLALLVWLVWALASAFSREAAQPWSLGQGMLSLAARIPGLRGPHTLTLLRGARAMLREQRLGLWVFGAISHALWTLAFGLVLVTLLLLFSFQAFQLSWETTILDAHFFERFLQITGWLPSQLGFAVPAQALVQAPPSAAGSQAIAWWLLASALLYGLLPRVVALVVCLVMWRRRASRLALDTRDPYFRRLVARFAAMAPAPVINTEHAAPRPPASQGLRARSPGQTARTVLIGYELPDDLGGPPADLLALADHIHTIRGSMAERLALLGALAAEPGADALVLCSAAASPDRGAERFLRQVGEQTASCALLPLALEAAGADNKPQRWADWLAASGLSGVTFCATLEDARHWLETHRG